MNLLKPHVLEFSRIMTVIFYFNCFLVKCNSLQTENVAYATPKITEIECLKFMYIFVRWSGTNH